MKQLIKKIGTLLQLSALALIIGCSEESVKDPIIIPMPAEMNLTGGTHAIDAAALESTGDLVKHTINSKSGIAEEGYKLSVTSSGIEIEASTEAGIFYATQTLKQLYSNGSVPCVEIKDEPRMGYRGMMLDVSRHFFDKDEVIKIIDALALYKINRLHMHLTDGGGWRLEMDSYPKLTEMTGYRTESDWQKWWDWNGDDNARKFVTEGTEGAYGGYYTKDDMRAIIDYATKKHIIVIPEIEFPGHSNEVFVAYPELCCSGKPYKEGDFCIGNPESYVFMEKVLSEVMELFPSEYIHIGGDEAGKGAWKKCPKCQALMKKEGFTHIDELQSYMIKYADRFIASKGRKLVGWDEILEGGLAEGATVMSWRGESGGIAAARANQDVIMTPGSHLYFDHFQADPRNEPYAIGGYTPVKKVYSYNPVPVDSLTVEQQKHIVGVQANVWTEFMKTKEHLEYMIFPRILALAEVAWTPQEMRSWESFKPRVNAHLPLLESMGLNAFKLSTDLDIAMEVDYQKQQISVNIDAERYPAEIRYTTDGSQPTAESQIFTEPIIVTDSANITAAIFENGVMAGTATNRSVDYHKAIGKTITFNNKLYHGYMAGGEDALINGVRGGLTYLDNCWQGYLTELDCVIDLGEESELSNISTRFMQLIGPGVYLPKDVTLLISSDGETFTECETIATTISPEEQKLSFTTYEFKGDWKARYVKIKVSKVNDQFIFADEIVVW